MSLHNESELSARLAAHVSAATTVPDTQADAAQQRVLARLRNPSRSARPFATRRWLALAASLVIAVVAFLAAPLLSPSGNAFAAVQQHFRDFHTLVMEISQRHDGELLQTSRTLINADGVSRTDVGSQLSIIVDPVQGRVLTLLHDDRQASLAAIPATRPSRGNSLQWLDELRVFKGRATPINESRQIDGHAAHGWRLNVGGSALELWADENGLPLSMRQPGAQGLQIDYRFTFNAPVADGELSTTPPPGYRVVDAEAE